MPHKNLICEKIRELEHTIVQFAEHDEHGFPVLDDDVRWKLHVLACSVTDCTFWVKKSKRFPGFTECIEVETGVTAYGEDARTAVSNYFDGNYDFPL